MGGSPCPPSLMEAVQKDLNMSSFLVAYGMTETSPVSFSNTPDDSAAMRATTCGTVLQNVEAKIVNDEGKLVPLGESGELIVKGYLVMQG